MEKINEKYKEEIEQTIKKSSLFQDKLKKEIVFLDKQLQHYFYENYFDKNKYITFNVSYYRVFLDFFKNKELKKKLYEDIIKCYKHQISDHKMILGIGEIKESYSNYEIKNKKKLLVKELKKSKKKLKENSIHKKIVSNVKNENEEDVFSLISDLLKTDKERYFNKKETILKYFKFLERTFNFKIDYNIDELNNSSFDIVLNSNKKINISFETNQVMGGAEGYYSPDEQSIVIITPKINKKENHISLNELLTLSHEIGHAAEDLFEDVMANESSIFSELISMYFERLTLNEFIHEVIKDKDVIEVIKFRSLFDDFSLNYITLNMLKNKNQNKMKIKDKELNVYKGYLKLNMLSSSLFHLKHTYVSFDEYFLGNYKSKKLNLDLTKKT